MPARKTQSFAGDSKNYLRDVCERNIDVKYRNGHGWTLRKSNFLFIQIVKSHGSANIARERSFSSQRETASITSEMCAKRILMSNIETDMDGR